MELYYYNKNEEKYLRLGIVYVFRFLHPYLKLTEYF